MTEEQRQLAMDVQNTFGTVAGKRTLKWLMEKSGYEDKIEASQVSAGMVMFFLGGRQMYIIIKDEMDRDTAAPLQQDVAKVNAAVNQENVQQETAVE